MYGQDRVFELLHDVLSRVEADASEATFMFDDEALTRFANNTIHQNVAQSNTRLAVRAVVNGGVGLAVTNRLDADGRRRVADQAARMARLQPPDPDFPGLAPGGAVRPAQTFYETTAAATPARRAEGVRVIVDAAAGRGYLATGALSTQHGELAIANTAGARVYAPTTLASLRAVVDANPPAGLGIVTGYADIISRDLDAIDAAAVATRAVDKTAIAAGDALPRGSSGPDLQVLPPGHYVTILEEIAVADLLRFLARWGLSAKAAQEGRSFAVGQMEQPVCGENFTLWDDAADARNLALPFDWEGMPAQKLCLIDRGVLKELAYDRRTAEAAGRASTGHAMSHVGGFGTPWPVPTHLFVAPGATSREALIEGVERGVLVTRFHYTHCPEPQRLVVTGTTRDGTFLIEDGRIVAALQNARFTESVLDTFSKIDALSDTTELHRDWWGSAAHHVPAMRVHAFAFTGGAQ
ncbi:MAG: TldD/PmbA family protein [Anaerolineae bacterium]|jgi:predicted Zn-dependent protease